MIRSKTTRLRSGRPSSTAEITAQMRAADAMLPPARRLLGDSYAGLFVSNPRYRMMTVTPGTAWLALRIFDRLFGGYLAATLLRARHFDEALADAAARGVRQVVLLGAGYDSTALRHSGLAGVRFFEVDHPVTQRAKLAALRDRGVSAANVTYVPVDLEEEGVLPGAVVSRGFNTDEPCLVGWHGVSFFLEPESFVRSLTEIRDVCAPSSQLIFDYMDEAVINGSTPYRGARRAARSVRSRGEPYTLGLTPDSAAAAVSAAGFRCVENIRTTDLVRRYGGFRPYCRNDDFMGVLAVERIGDAIIPNPGSSPMFGRAP